MIASFTEKMAYILVRTLVFALSLCPESVQRVFFSTCLDIFLFIKPRYKHIAFTNIQKVYPYLHEQDVYELYREHKKVLASLLVDIVRLPKMNADWIKKNVTVHGLKEFEELRKQHPEKGVLFVAGHLSSFEILPNLLFFNSGKIHYLVRRFKHAGIDQWWNKRRTFQGNEVIDKEGGFKKMLRLLQKGEQLGILFDQNVKRNHAVFVDWFGMPAATTKGPALAILQAKPLTFVLGLKRHLDGSFEIDLAHCDVERFVSDSTLTKEEKIVRITQKLVEMFSKHVKEHPENWFWMHRRWKTTEREDIPEDFYDQKVAN